MACVLPQLRIFLRASLHLHLYRIQNLLFSAENLRYISLSHQCVKNDHLTDATTTVVAVFVPGLPLLCPPLSVARVHHRAAKALNIAAKPYKSITGT